MNAAKFGGETENSINTVQLSSISFKSVRFDLIESCSSRFRPEVRPSVSYH